MWKKIADIILRNRFFILGIIALITVFFGFHAYTGIQLDNSTGIFLPKDSKTSKTFLFFLGGSGPGKPSQEPKTSKTIVF